MTQGDRILSEEAASSVAGPMTQAESGRLGIEGAILRRFLRAVGSPPIRVVLWDGRVVGAPVGEAVTTIRVADRLTLWKLMADPELRFGEGYMDGRITVDGDLVELMTAVDSAQTPSRISQVGRLLRQMRRPRASSLRRARKNIHQHYDIGNDFYRLWLDERMVYTCAYFRSPEASLEEAQIAKMDHVCRKVRLQPNERVVDAGCGWGALALHMARHYGVTVRAFNISHEQVVYARERARAEGLEGRVEFIEDDYRNITSPCDAFVSVGMLEHVGKENYRELGRVIDRCLGSQGRGLIHSIGRNRPLPLNRWAEKYIFPGAYMPSLSEMMEIFEPYDFSVLDVENLRLHYVRTLRSWLERFERSADRVRAMFDERFVRMWRLYLAGSISGFSTGWLQLFQVTFARGRSNQIPWTRAYLYGAP